MASYTVCVFQAWYINHGRDNKPGVKWSHVIVLTQIQRRHTSPCVLLLPFVVTAV